MGGREGYLEWGRVTTSFRPRKKKEEEEEEARKGWMEDDKKKGKSTRHICNRGEGRDLFVSIACTLS